MRITERDANQLYISTRCRTASQFVAVFQRYVRQNSIFVSTLGTRVPGRETAFVIVLADGTPVLRGTCVIREVWRTVKNPYGLPGMELGIRTLSPRSLAVFEKMQRKWDNSTLPSFAPPPPLQPVADEDPLIEPPAPAPEVRQATSPVAQTSTTPKYFSPVPRTSSGSFSPVPASAAPVVERTGESFSAPTRLVPGVPERVPEPSAVTPIELSGTSVPCILPANPFKALSDEALAGYVDCTLYEEQAPRPRARAIQRAARWSRSMWLVGALAVTTLAVGAWSSALPPNPRGSQVAPAAVAVASARGSDPRVELAAAARAWPERGDGPCRLVVSSTPPEATVTIDGKTRGSSPLTIDAPCGQHRVTIARDGYEATTAWAMLAPGQPEAIDVPLARPIHELYVTSSPRARIYLGGTFAGWTPERLSVLGHVPVTVELRRPGFESVTRHLPSTTPRQWLALRLHRLASHDARPAAPRPTVPAAATKVKPARAR